MDFEHLETFYETLADTLDTVAEEDRNVYLCKLCLLLARDLTDPAGALAHIDSARRNLAGGSK